VILRNGRVLRVRDLSAMLHDVVPELVLCCADQPPVEIHAAVLEYCLLANAACTFGAVGVSDGTFGPLLTTPLALQQFSSYLGRVRGQLQGVEVMSASIGWTNTIIGAMMTGDALQHLMGIESVLSRSAIVRLSFQDYSHAVIHRFE